MDASPKTDAMHRDSCYKIAAAVPRLVLRFKEFQKANVFHALELVCPFHHLPLRVQRFSSAIHAGKYDTCL